MAHGNRPELEVDLDEAVPVEFELVESAGPMGAQVIPEYTILIYH